MAIWQGIYFDIVEKKYFVNLLVYQNNSLNQRINTNYEQDKTILPSVYQSHLRQVNDATAKIGCTKSFITYRQGIFYITPNDWWVVPIPFLPLSNQWNEFWQEVKANDLIQEFDYIGDSRIFS